jgi:predicted RNase H-like nuclease
MRFVGIDLAWGGRRPSGLAVLDPGGAVAGGGWATTAEEIGEFLADAHVCAYVGLWWWAHGPAATLVAGDDATGAILVPRP